MVFLKRTFSWHLALSLLILLVTIISPVQAQVKTVVASQAGSHRLLRNGQPYFIKGVGGERFLARLAAAGGNSIRTWSTENLEVILDEAAANNLTVCVGFWLGHERHGFDYQDESSVVKQLDACLTAVRQFKEHPAVLMWAVGNEMEGGGNNPAIWYAVDHIARECKRIDPDHPTMTVIAELGTNKVQNIERFCPHVDIVGVNTYGGVGSMAQRYRAAGGTKPYIVTEFGPFGPWEVEKTSWGSAVEASSTKKAQTYAQGYQKAVTEQAGLCLGSYAFLWGHKQETTATWFGMLLPNGVRLGAVDVMSEAWTGRSPQNRCPEIESLSLSATENLKPREVVTAKLVAADPEGDALSIRWALRYDSGTIGSGGDFQAEETILASAVVGKGSIVTLEVPPGGGAYRLFAYVEDDQGGAAVANVPLFVDAPLMRLKAPKAELPFTLYGEENSPAPYAPSGFMGNTAAIQMTFDSQESPYAGKTCLRVAYDAADAWGGVLWQSPPNDWLGEKPGGLNLTGAQALEFWARGEAGGEVVNFVLGVLEGDMKYPDSTKAEIKEVRLTQEWQKLRIPLDGRDLTRIKTGFGWSLAGQGKPVTFYLDEIRYVPAASSP
ncbi:MAG: hypothetical protein MK165_06825 [Pirellulaceae bacterium]|nr:hypothetical protein [Pirellulaceae bacterium]